MSALGRLVLYVMEHNRISEPQARAWLDRHCPRWQSSEPVRGRLVEREQQEHEESNDDPAA